MQNFGVYDWKVKQNHSFVPSKNKKPVILWYFLHNDSRPTLTYFTISLSSFSRSLHLSLDFFHASSRCFCLKTTHVRILPSLNSTLCSSLISLQFLLPVFPSSPPSPSPRCAPCVRLWSTNYKCIVGLCDSRRPAIYCAVNRFSSAVVL